MEFSYSTRTTKNISQAMNDITTNLKDIGFGVLGTLDFKNILESKGLDFQTEYKLMEVCNPKLAKQVLETNPEMGLLLPCTIVFYQKNGENWISLARPTSLLKMASEENMQFMGQQIEEKLIQVLDKSK